MEKYCMISKAGSKIELVEWENGEGVDICIIGEDSDGHVISLTYGTIDAIHYLSKSLQFN
jgi:hypothetical protein